MAVFDFPTSPAINDEYTLNGVTYRWNGYGWVIAGEVPEGGGVIISDIPPEGVVPGQLWWENDTGILWLWYDDGNSQQWMQAAGATAPPTVKPVASGIINGVSLADIGLPGEYEQYRFVMQGHAPMIDGNRLFMRFSTDGGFSFDAGPTAYGWTESWVHSDAALAAPVVSLNQTTDTGIVRTGIALSPAGESIQADAPSLLDISISLGSTVKGYQPGLTFSHRVFFAGSPPTLGLITGVGQYGSLTRITHFRLAYTANAVISNGHWMLYGSMR